MYKFTQGNGTGTFSRHLRDVHFIVYDKVQKKVKYIGGGGGGGGLQQTQTQLGGFMSEVPGGGIPWHYNRNVMIENMATFVTLDEQPFNYGESLHLEKFNKLSLQPAYSRVPRNTLKREIIKQYANARLKIIKFFENFDGRVSITSDGWTSITGDSYLCVTVHWIDNVFNLHKRIIAFDVMDESHSGINIYNRMNGTLKEFNLDDKVFTISFDNATANTKCIEHVKKNYNLPVDGALLHVRCCAHIINLSVQEGISFISPLIEPIRKVAKWARNNQNIRRQYKQLCLVNNLKFRKLLGDCVTRWNSTYEMLSLAIKYKKVVTQLYNDYHESIGSDLCIDESSWTIGEHVCDLLGSYNHATHVFSYVYEPNVHLVIMECISIVKCMTDCEANEPCLKPVIFDMKIKWLGYFFDFPHIYGIAVLLDPGLKLNGLTNMLTYYYTTLGIEYDVKKYVDECISILTELYSLYGKDSNSSAAESSRPSKSRRFLNNALANIILKKSSSTSDSSSASSIVTEFINSHHSTDDEDFNILHWWRDHAAQYPTLARLARDILVVPASTIASESAFSAGKRVVSEKRSRLTPESVKICVCKKDWDLAENRQQGQASDDDIEDDPFMTMNTSEEGSGVEEDNEDEDN